MFEELSGVCDFCPFKYAWLGTFLRSVALRCVKWWHPAFLAMKGNHKPAHAAMGFIILQLHGHAPYGKHHCVSSLCGVSRQAGSWRRLDFHCELFMVSLNGALMKNRDRFRPPVLVRFYSWEPHILRKLFLCLVTKQIFEPISMINWESVSVFFKDTKQTVYSRYYYFQTVSFWNVIAVRNSESLHMCWLFFDLTCLKDVWRWNICIHPNIILQLSVPYCINPSNLLCVCPVIRLRKYPYEWTIILACTHRCPYMWVHTKIWEDSQNH